MDLIRAKYNVDRQDEKLDEESIKMNDKKSQLDGSEREIKDKLKLLETRNFQLQSALDKNVYKRKMMYGLISLIILLFLAIIGLFYYRS